MARFPLWKINHVAMAGVKPPKIPVARLYAKEKPDTRTFAGMISVRNTTIEPLYPPKISENHNAAASSRSKDGALTSHDRTGYGVTSASVENNNSIGRRPTLSETVPIVGSRQKFEMPTRSVTSMLDVVVRRSTLLPYVGMYAVIM